MNTKSEAMENRAANITKEREDSDEVRLTQFECKLKETRTIRRTSTTIYREQSNAIRGKKWNPLPAFENIRAIRS